MVTKWKATIDVLVVKFMLDIISARMIFSEKDEPMPKFYCKKRMRTAKKGYSICMTPLTYERFLPCQFPPWGQLVAVDIANGKIQWRIPHGHENEARFKGITGSRCVL